MKSLIRSLVFYAIGLFLLQILLDGVTIAGGFWTIFFGAVVLTLLFSFVKPILTILTFPLNVVTLGLMSFFVNMLLLYLLTVFIPSIKIQAFVFQGLSYAGFVLPRMHVNDFFAFAVSALILSVITTTLSWLTK